MSDRFKPEQFQIAPFVAVNFELDAEVAARIVNEIWVHNKQGQIGNNHEIQSFHVDPTATVITGALNPSNEHTGLPTLTASFKAHKDNDFFGGADPTLSNNTAFAEAVQRTFDMGERRGRADAKRTSAFIGIPLTAAAVGEYFVVNSGEAPVIDAATPLIVGLTAFILSPGIGNSYRRIITNPNYKRINKMHLQRAAKLAESLSLPPVIS